jgi:hypothetical protein
MTLRLPIVCLGVERGKDRLRASLYRSVAALSVVAHRRSFYVENIEGYERPIVGGNRR